MPDTVRYSVCARSDAQMRVLTANAAFEALCGARDIASRPLAELLSQVPDAPAEGRTETVEVKTDAGQSVTLTFSRRGTTVAVLARRGGRAAVDAIAARHGEETGRAPVVFAGSSPGAHAFGVRRLAVAT